MRRLLHCWLTALVGLAGLVASCSLNPQPEPPMATADTPRLMDAGVGNGGSNGGAGGSTGQGGAAVLDAAVVDSAVEAPAADAPAPDALPDAENADASDGGG